MTISDAGTFLTKILDHKRTEVARQALKVPIAQLQANIAAAPPPRAFDAALKKPGRVALIAEVKKASPSKGVLVENFDPLALARTYAENGAAAISVLTDVRFFQGSLKYLQGIRERLGIGDWGLGSATQSPIPNPQSPIPILRKDFILDSYQVYEARAYGADALLLIVAALDDVGPFCRLRRRIPGGPVVAHQLQVLGRTGRRCGFGVLRHGEPRERGEHYGRGPDPDRHLHR